MTFGSRFAGMGDPLGGGMPLYRYLGNRLTTVAQNLFLGTRFTDMHSGMRAYTRAALESLPFLGYPDGFSFDAELLVDAVTSGLRVVEVPIPTRYSEESSSISVSRSLEYVVHGTVYAARQALARGAAARGTCRRGGGAAARGRAARWRSDAASLRRAIGWRCAYPAHGRGRRSDGGVPLHDDRLGVHDDILECPRCGLLSLGPTLDPDGDRRRGYEDVVDEDVPDGGGGAPRAVRVGARSDRLRLAVGATGSSRSAPTSGCSSSVGDGRRVERRRRRALGLGGGRRDASVRGRPAARDGARRSSSMPASVDAIVMLDVLEHLDRPDALRCSGSARSSHERGLLALCTVNVEGLHGRAAGRPLAVVHPFPPALLPAADAPRGMLERRGVRGGGVGDSSPARSTSPTCCTARRAPSRAPRSRSSGPHAWSTRRSRSGWIGDVTLRHGAASSA